MFRFIVIDPKFTIDHGLKIATKQNCDECNQKRETLVEYGEPPDYELTLYICEDCLEEGLELIKQYRENNEAG